jgi:hypothetical protein
MVCNKKNTPEYGVYDKMIMAVRVLRVRVGATRAAVHAVCTTHQAASSISHDGLLSLADGCSLLKRLIHFNIILNVCSTNVHVRKTGIL